MLQHTLVGGNGSNSSTRSSHFPAADSANMHAEHQQQVQQQQQETVEAGAQGPWVPMQRQVDVTSSPAILTVRQGEQQQQQPAHPQMAAAAAAAAGGADTGGGAAAAAAAASAAAGKCDDLAARKEQARRNSEALHEAMELAKDLMMQHGLDDEWTFSFNSRKRYAGLCYFRAYEGGSIQFFDVLRHEPRGHARRSH
jgi:hypothetical protein